MVETGQLAIVDCLGVSPPISPRYLRCSSRADFLSVPHYYPPVNNVNYAWALAAVFMPISFGWAAGDVSLAAYIQACLARREADSRHVSALGAVMVHFST